MESRRSAGVAALGAAIVLAMLSAGCATKKYVQNEVVTPLEAKIGGVDKKVDQKSAENAQQITDLDRKTEKGISDAQSSADSASKQATEAGQQAQQAQQLAQKGVDQANQVAQQVENIDNYQSVKSATVLFPFDKSTLTTDAKQELDSLGQTFSGLKHYAVEVKGYTDHSGPKAYNLELSRRRADAVVRYLTEQEKVPLVRIHLLGYGEDAPVGSNHTRQGRKDNRRVEVTVMAPQTASASNAQGSPNTTTQ